MHGLLLQGNANNIHAVSAGSPVQQLLDIQLEQPSSHAIDSQLNRRPIPAVTSFTSEVKPICGISQATNGQSSGVVQEKAVAVHLESSTDSSYLPTAISSTPRAAPKAPASASVINWLHYPEARSPVLGEHEVPVTVSHAQLQSCWQWL
jgi:hypothetical protein